MNRFFGRVGYLETVDTGNGVWGEHIIYRKYYGDVERYSKRWSNSGKLNDDLTVDVVISIVADDYADLHMANIKCVEFNNALWTVSSIEPIRPRIKLTLGGVYNAPEE